MIVSQCHCSSEVMPFIRNASASSLASLSTFSASKLKRQTLPINNPPPDETKHTTRFASRHRISKTSWRN